MFHVLSLLTYIILVYFGVFAATRAEIIWTREKYFILFLEWIFQPKIHLIHYSSVVFELYLIKCICTWIKGMRKTVWKYRESNLITVQQDATVFSSLHFCRQLYMFRVLTPIIRSWYSCNYSFWYWLTGSTTIRSPCWDPTQQGDHTV